MRQTRRWYEGGGEMGRYPRHQLKLVAARQNPLKRVGALHILMANKLIIQPMQSVRFSVLALAATGFSLWSRLSSAHSPRLQLKLVASRQNPLKRVGALPVLLTLLVLLLCSCRAAPPLPAEMGATATVPVEVVVTPLTTSTACLDHFVTHKLPFATGTRLREIKTYESNGAGVAVNDLDQDGDLDLVFASIDSESEILWNEGALKFTAEPLADRFTRGVATVDVDGDGWLDIVFTHRGHETLSYWHNQGQGNGGQWFARSELVGVESYAYAMSWADLNADGALDLVTGSYNTDLRQQGIDDPTKDQNAGVFLYTQDPTTRATFESLPLTAKAEALAIALIDLDADGQRDIWVGNDFDLPDQVWVQPAGTWQLASPFAETSFSTMSIDWGDLTNNGLLALFTTDMNPYDTSPIIMARWLPMLKATDARHQRFAGDRQQMVNTLQVPVGVGEWQNVSNQQRVDATGWSWAGKLGDLDSDGYLDIYVVNGMIATNLFAHLPDGELVEENQAFRNQGDGSFQPAPAWQLGAITSGRGMMMADLDNDGDLDIVVNNLRQSAQLFENQLCGGQGLQVELQWPSSLNRFGVGAQLLLKTDKGTMQRDVRTTSGYLSGDPVRVHFGFGVDVKLEGLLIRWPDGASSVVAGIAPQGLARVVRRE